MRKILPLTLTCISLITSSYGTRPVDMNEDLPMMVDEHTELNNICLLDKTITYTYHLKNVSLNEALTHITENKSSIVDNACTDAFIQDLFNKNLDIKFIYKIADKTILEVKINKQFCQQQCRDYNVDDEKEMDSTQPLPTHPFSS